MKHSYYIKALLIVAALGFIGIVYVSSRDKTGSYYYIAMDYDRQMSMKRIPVNEGNIKKVRFYFEKAHQSAPKNVNILYAYGNFLYQYNFIEKAKNYYRMAFKLEKDKTKLYQILFATLHDGVNVEKEYLQAFDTSEIALEFYPDDVTILNGLAWFYATANIKRLQSPKKALKYAKLAVKLSDRKDPAILDTLAAAYYINFEYQKAVDIQKEALNKIDSDKDGYQKKLNQYIYALNQQKTTSKE